MLHPSFFDRFTWLIRCLAIASLLCLATAATAQTDPAAEPEPPPPTAGEEPAAESEPPAPGESALEPTPGAAPAPSEGVEEITVIGEVLETSTQAEAAAITTFDQSQLDTLGIADVEDLALNTPSLHFGQVGQQAVITLRGVGLENLTSVGEAGVGFQVDGVHLGRPSAANATFFDLERVDVLRGPQGTQGGRQTNGGRIALWSKKPNEELEAFGDVTIGNYSSTLTRSVLNAPIWEEKLMSRVSATFSRHDGYQDNDLYSVESRNAHDARDFAGRAQLRSLLLDQNLELLAIGSHSYQKGRGYIGTLRGGFSTTLIDAISRNQSTGFDFARFLPGCKWNDEILDVDAVRILADCVVPKIPGNERRTLADWIPDRDNEQNGITGFATYDFPWFSDTPLSDLKMRFIGSFQQNIEDSIADTDGLSVPDQYFDLRRNSKQHSFEVYVERPDVGRFDFKTGFYYFKEDIDTKLCFDVNSIAEGFDLGYDALVTTESYAGYGEGGVRVLPNLRVFGGLRWTNDEKFADQTNYSFVRNDSPDDPYTLCGSRFGLLTGTDTVRRAPTRPEDVNVTTDNYPGWTPNVGFEWQMTDTATLGFNVTRGFKAGGFPLVVQNENPAANQSYDSEFTWEYEISLKQEIFDGRLRLNTTLFWTEYDPFQICQIAGPIFFCRSDGNATLRGLEIEATATPIDGLQLNGFFNLLDARVNDFQIVDPTVRQCAQVDAETGTCYGFVQAANLNPVDVSGNYLPRAPAWAGSLGIQYEFDVGRWGFLTPRFQTQFQGDTYFRVFNNDELDLQEAFFKFDTTLNWRSEDDRFFTEFFVYNLTDQTILNSQFIGSFFTGGQVLGQYQPPRLYGVKFGINYVSDWLAEML